jgi:phenylpropionate dioxygenase-like ring-hydroxylating dioxygenase large terminal subunit
MLSPQDNERLTHVGRGTPMGEVFRRYWLPVLLSSELGEQDGAPVRVRILGEDLIAFRDTNGKVGLLDAYCPHRRAPMFYGRNEECGLRCVYHGWKFDITGKCVELPTEPATSKMKDHIKIMAYPTVERGGVVWAYMGPADQMPAEPDYEWTRAPATHRHVSKTFERCNYLQALEGGLDTAHSSFVHNNKLGDKTDLRQRDLAPRLDVEKTEYGYTYTSTRKNGDDGSYIRVYQYMMPTQQMRGGVTGPRGRNSIPKIDGHIWVPIDDDTTYVYNWMYGYDETAAMSPEFIEHHETFCGRGPNDVIPGTFMLKKNPSNDYFIDRQIQKTQTYTGIVGLNTQDFALQEGMGAVVDRSKENLGSSDRAIIQMRNLLLEATQVVEAGERPRGTDPETYRLVRPFDGLLGANENWKEVFAEDMRARW